ncbi:hypothetical protein SOCE26_075810 [Sorangium cellulosum]|uniref:RNA polymerase sigma factor 70 region 4 type 2 domain-containing protein n=1 Tax=Sorangium cellulosum TaxID=56 RepID=A0A2L0F3F4_SORCE|nr:sigma-70 family RNA polymerase sigma factor [Sorangium cellulosum]AUX46076.1 hypothetical protein SOCE26_075810 [Sorangium cellulosum]
MSKKRKGAKRPPAAPPKQSPPRPPPVHVEPEAILAESGMLRAVLTNCGVPAADLDDVLQEVLIGALVAVREDRYRPEPDLHPRSVLRRWLVGIAVHQASKYHDKAYRRREVAYADPHRVAHEPAPSPHGPVEARDLLAQLRLLRPRERIILLLVGEGEQVSQVARSLGVPVETAFSRLRLGRKHLAHVLKRWRRLR